jgi:excisionase family DNA binding protein
VDEATPVTIFGATLCAVSPSVPPSGPPRFLPLADVAEVLNISSSQAYALVRSGDLKAIRVGGRGQWRVEVAELEAYIQRSYRDTQAYVAEHPFGRGDDDDGGGATAGE